MRRAYHGNRLRLGVARCFSWFCLLWPPDGHFSSNSAGEKLKRLGERQHLKEWIVLPKRGAVMDRTGEPLALSLEAQSVYARPHRIHDLGSVSRALAKILISTLFEVKQKITADKPFVGLSGRSVLKKLSRSRP